MKDDDSPEHTYCSALYIVPVIMVGGSLRAVSLLRNWTDSSISLDERQIKECLGGWQNLLPLPNFSRKIEGHSALRVGRG